MFDKQGHRDVKTGQGHEVEELHPCHGGQTEQQDSFQVSLNDGPLLTRYEHCRDQQNQPGKGQA